jgi:predicted enzyme related to lactoylglutathione lyase
MSDRQWLPGKFVWFELVTKDAKKAQAFYGEVLGWTVRAFPMGPHTYEMIYAEDTMIGGYASPRSDAAPALWLSYVSVEDVDAAAKLVVAGGGKLLEPARDVPGAGRMVRIADPQGAELCLFTRTNGDPPDELTPLGQWVWNELHTRDTSRALAFYQDALGFSDQPMDGGPSGTYHVLSRGGVGRGGLTGTLPEGRAPYWLPYVHVDDVDATVARARKLGGTAPFGPEDIPGIGRLSALVYPGGAPIAVMKPLPRMSAG